MLAFVATPWRDLLSCVWEHSADWRELTYAQMSIVLLSLSQTQSCKHKYKWDEGPVSWLLISLCSGRDNFDSTASNKAYSLLPVQSYRQTRTREDNRKQARGPSHWSKTTGCRLWLQLIISERCAVWRFQKLNPPEWCCRTPSSLPPFSLPLLSLSPPCAWSRFTSSLALKPSVKIKFPARMGSAHARVINRT